MKKIIIAPDSFKGTVSSSEICEIVNKGILSVFPGCKTVEIPMADGGEGTVDSFLSAIGGKKIECIIKGPFFEDIHSFFSILKDGNTAVIEVAAACGLDLVGEKKNPMHTTSYGVGQLMKAAMDAGCKKLIIGLGGSATNDAGIGMAGALGAKFTDSSGKPVPLNGEGLNSLAHMDISGVDRRIKEMDIIAACDVDNPLYGENGAAYVYAPQKGASPKEMAILDKGLQNFADFLKKDLKIDVANVPGAGAAGGLGAGFYAFAGGKIKSGIDILLDISGFDEEIKDADLVITGEGKIDGQSIRGKVPVGVAKRAKRENVPVIVVAGDIGDGTEALEDLGITAIFSTNKRAVPFTEAKKSAKEDILTTVQNVMKTLKILC